MNKKILNFLKKDNLNYYNDSKRYIKPNKFNMKKIENKFWWLLIIIYLGIGFYWTLAFLTFKDGWVPKVDKENIRLWTVFRIPILVICFVLFSPMWNLVKRYFHQREYKYIKDSSENNVNEE